MRFYEESDLVNLEEDFLQRAKELLNDEFKAYLSSIENRENQLKITNQELNEERRRLEEDKKDFLENKNTVIATMMSKFGLDLVPNQKVFIIRRYTNWETCNNCGGAGEFKKTVDNLVYKAPCPVCNGYKRIAIHDYKILSGKISDAKISLYWNSRAQTLKEVGDCGEAFLDESSSFYIRDLPKEQRLDTTEERQRHEIYLTEEEAQEALKAMSKKERE